LVLSITDSALQFSLVNVFQFARVLFFAILAGVVADRYPRRSVLVITLSLSGLLAGTLAVVVATDRVELWHVYVLALCLGVVNAFDMPTRQAFVFDVGADGFGILMSALGVGSLTGALFLAFSGRGARPRQILVTAVILGVAEIGLAVVSSVRKHVAFALLVLPIMGFSLSATNAMANTIVQSASSLPCAVE